MHQLARLKTSRSSTAHFSSVLFIVNFILYLCEKGVNSTDYIIPFPTLPLLVICQGCNSAMWMIDVGQARELWH